MEEITEEEQKAAFDLANTLVSIKMLLTAKQRKPRVGIRLLYFKAIGIASKLGIVLQDPPPEETATDAEMQTFITKQDNHIFECLARKGNMHINILYKAGDQWSYLMAFLAFKCQENREERIEVNEAIRTCAEELKICATELDINLSEELEKAMNVKETDEITELGKQIKEKFCGGKPSQNERSELDQTRSEMDRSNQNKRSEIDETRFITDELWTVSLVRLPDSSHDEHAFLVVEGKSGIKSKIWFADFVTRDASDLYRPGMRDGKVRLDKHELNEDAKSSTKLLFAGCKEMMKIGNGARLLYSTWQIPKSTAETLIENIKAQKEKPPKYNVLGNTTLAASSATSSSNDTGHNCFTFARMMLRGLNDKHIKILEDTLDKWIVTVPSRYLVDEKQPINKSWNTPTFVLVLALVSLAGVTTAYFTTKLL